MTICLQGSGAKRSRRQRGNALVEQALVITFLLTVILGIIDFSRVLYAYHFVSNAACDATRWASVRSNNTNLPGGAASPANVQTFVSNVSGMGLDPAKVTTAIAWTAPPNGSPSCPPNTNRPGCVVQVSVNYAYTFLFPFLRQGNFTMTSTSQMVITQ
jgi:Flp pilus assembly protein TadG